jgi:hypothetical protein
MSPEDFLARVERAIVTRETTATGIGKGALGDPTFVFRLRKGRKVSLDVAQRVLDHIEKLPKRRRAA